MPKRALQKLKMQFLKPLSYLKKKELLKKIWKNKKQELKQIFTTESVLFLDKSFQLARYNEYAGSPGFIEQDIANIRAVTIDDVMRVYEKYIKDKPYLATSFVPKGQLDLVAENSVDAGIVEENITQATKVELAEAEVEEEIVKTRSKFRPFG